MKTRMILVAALLVASSSLALAQTPPPPSGDMPPPPGADMPPPPPPGEMGEMGERGPHGAPRGGPHGRPHGGPRDREEAGFHIEIGDRSLKVDCGPEGIRTCIEASRPLVDLLRGGPGMTGGPAGQPLPSPAMPGDTPPPPAPAN